MSALILGLYALRARLKDEPNPNRSARQVLKDLTKRVAAAGAAWLTYRRSVARQKDGKTEQPIVVDLLQDCHRGFADVQEMGIVRLSAMFEAFVQCWALNFLLAKLEAGNTLSRREKELLRHFNPCLSRGHVPGWPAIVTSLPAVSDRLQDVPHLFTNPITGQKVHEPTSVGINAYTAVGFWRAYRNQSVHSSGIATRQFHERYAAYFKECMSCFDHIPELVPGKPLPFHPDLYGAMAASHYRAALSLSEMLETESAGRRGHPEAPSPKTVDYWDIPPRSPAMLVAGDHVQSLQWIEDSAFRETVCTANGWPLPFYVQSVGFSPGTA